ncbi:MAG: 6-phosphofructokinase [Planctomycetota bacterium]
MSSVASTSANTSAPIKRVAILFAGGPAPAANAVISTAAAAFLRSGVEVIGIRHGYSKLEKYSPSEPLLEGEDFVRMSHTYLKRTRASQGIMIGTARANPGKEISAPEHLHDPKRSQKMRNTYEGLRSLGVDALISIGGDDTLKTANKFKMFQDVLPADAARIPVVHVPKTIDNDYHGIDFTFGYFTACDTLATEIRTLLYDAEATRGYFIAETMGRSAGWLSYGAAIAGEASLVLSVEDVTGIYRTSETYQDKKTGETKTREIMNLPKVIDRIVKLMKDREKDGKKFGVIVLAEGLAELMPFEAVKDVPRDEHGHLAIAEVMLGRRLAKLIAEAYTKETGKERKINGIQLGYESRCSKPHAFDVLLGSQLGVGAFRALVERRLNGVMVSVEGQLQLRYVPFDQLVDPKTLVTVVRYINPESDFYRLARFLELYKNTEEPSGS